MIVCGWKIRKWNAFSTLAFCDHSCKNERFSEFQNDDKPFDFSSTSLNYVLTSRIFRAGFQDFNANILNCPHRISSHLSASLPGSLMSISCLHPLLIVSLTNSFDFQTLSSSSRPHIMCFLRSSLVATYGKLYSTNAHQLLVVFLLRAPSWCPDPVGAAIRGFASDSTAYNYNIFTIPHRWYLNNADCLIHTVPHDALTTVFNWSINN